MTSARRSRSSSSPCSARSSRSGTAGLVRRAGIDDQKVIPLALGPGIVGAIVTGFIAWGTPTGGYPGLEGAFALQHAEITPWWQLAGVVVTMLIAALPCFLMCLFFERVGGGLRVTEEQELAGMDDTYWGIPNYDDEALEHTTGAPVTGVLSETRVPVER